MWAGQPPASPSGRAELMRSRNALGGGGEVGHHGHVFVFEVVTVEDVAAGIVGEAGDNFDFFGGM